MWYMNSDSPAPNCDFWGQRSCGHHCILQFHPQLLLSSSPQTKQDSEEWSPRPAQSGLVIICVYITVAMLWSPAGLAGWLLSPSDTTLKSSLALPSRAEAEAFLASSLYFCCMEWLNLSLWRALYLQSAVLSLKNCYIVLSKSTLTDWM